MSKSLHIHYSKYKTQGCRFTLSTNTYHIIELDGQMSVILQGAELNSWNWPRCSVLRNDRMNSSVASLLPHV